jgi:hypothetical protein
VIVWPLTVCRARNYATIVADTLLKTQLQSLCRSSSFESLLGVVVDGVVSIDLALCRRPLHPSSTLSTVQPI